MQARCIIDLRNPKHLSVAPPKCADGMRCQRHISWTRNMLAAKPLIVLKVTEAFTVAEQQPSTMIDAACMEAIATTAMTA